MTNSQKQWRASKQIQNRARELRKEMTPAKKKPCQALRGNQLDGTLFPSRTCRRRLYPAFLLRERKAAIEIDGDVHLGQELYDKERTRWLEEEKGYKVIRFTNDDVLKNVTK